MDEIELEQEILLFQIKTGYGVKFYSYDNAITMAYAVTSEGYHAVNKNGQIYYGAGSSELLAIRDLVKKY